MTECKKKCEVFSRVVGYYRPVQFWNDGKQKEFEERKPYCEKKSLESSDKIRKKSMLDTSKEEE